MHQPDYRDSSGIMQMPWVFLHAIKDYYDMPWMMARHDSMRATFNITPPLMAQLRLYYNEPHRYDRFLSLWLKDPNYLNEEERSWIIKICKSAQYETMVLPLKRFAQLYNQEHLQNHELFDLELLFMLSWCGLYLRQNSELVKGLLQKERDYSYDDKAALLQELSRFVAKIFDYYAELAQSGRITLSTTPLYHPILPLLIDMSTALHPNPNTKIPRSHMPLYEDAKIHVMRAKELFLESFGFYPKGFWPAEGAVDEKSVALLQECGIEWIATDEEILFKSLNSHAKESLYKAYDYKGMRIGFRDKTLSDLIGFSYRHQEAYTAAEHFMGELAKINAKYPDATLFVILDGENAWEFYKNNAFDFFDALYTKLQNTSWVATLNMDEVQRLQATPLPYLASGSWIHGEFNTWVGHSEKTRAWELVYLAKRDFEHHKDSLDSTTQSEICEHFLKAESSDWFWWYGDDHFSEFGAEFDELFRSHLISVYKLMHLTPPSDLFIPIIKEVSAQDFWLKPQSDISPDINGKHDSFFEWIGCGVINETKIFSTMDRERGPISKILYGQDDTKIYFAFEANMKKLCEIESINVIIDPLGISGRVKLSNSKSYIGELEVVMACENWFEMSIEKHTIDLDEIAIRFELESEGSVVQMLPGFGELKIDLGNDYSQNWFI